MVTKKIETHREWSTNKDTHTQPLPRIDKSLKSLLDKRFTGCQRREEK